MTFYEELQLNQTGSKNIIRECSNKKEKLRHILIYIFKVFITLAFCISFVTLFSLVFGSENSIAGVVVLLFILIFRQTDFNINSFHSILNMFLISGIMGIGSYIAYSSSIFFAFITNFICIFLITVLSCHNVHMFNHSIVVMCYILLFGYEVTEKSYIMRLLGLILGALICSIIIYRKTINKNYEKNFSHLFTEFDIKTERSKWQLSLALSVSTAMFVGQLLGFKRVIWIGFSALAVSQISPELRIQKAIHRIPGTLAGVLLFYIFYKIIPMEFHNMLGILGGLCVGFCTLYGFQTMFNCLGAMSVAVDIIGIYSTILFRIIDTLFGVLYGVVFHHIFDKLHLKYINKNSELHK